jgi:hypothetical protein
MRFPRPLGILVASIALIVQSSAQDRSQGQDTARARSAPSSGEIKNGIYHNPFFGFSYKIPFGWVDRTKEMREPDDQAKSLVLLSIFERPPEATGNTINSAVAIAAEKLSSFSGIKTATDYFVSIKELAEAKGFKAINEPYADPIGSNQLIRGDFSKPRGTVTMYQSSLASLGKGYALSYTFIAGSEDELEKLRGNLSFGAQSTNTK